jgi:hypothetical protein
MISSFLAKYGLRYGLYLAGGLVLGILAKNWLNHHDAKVTTEARIEATKQISAAKEVEWKAQQKQIDKQRTDLASEQKTITQDREAIEAIRKSLARDRAVFETNYQTKLAELEKQRKANIEIINNIPAAMLDGAIRTKSSDLAKPGPANP